jgi:small-conductance mechanosensitive channel
MSGSYVFLLHLIAFGLASALLTANIILERKLRSEPDWSRKIFLGGMMKTFSIISPIAIVLFLVTGIGNIHNRYLESPEAWYTEGWLVAKIILFAILATNSLVFGPQLAGKRMQIIRALSDNTASADAKQQLKGFENQISLFFMVQLILFLSILFLSVFGGAKHPGAF